MKGHLVITEDREKLFSKRPGEQCVLKVIGTITSMSVDNVSVDIDDMEVEENATSMQDAAKRAEAQLARLAGAPIVRSAVEPYPG